MTEIMFCGCTHDFQDSVYGSHKRVFNESKKGFRCTVCKNEQYHSKPNKETVTSDEAKEKADTADALPIQKGQSGRSENAQHRAAHTSRNS
jgi:hypothetical protein